MSEATSSSSSMSRTSAKRRRSNWVRSFKKGDEDIISSLPDEVLCHILSFLPTKYAVGTSILSTRWRNLWTSVANLYLDDILLFDYDKLLAFLDCKNAFANFVDRVLNPHIGQSIQKLHLRLTGAYDSPRVNAWIYAAIMRNVVDVDFCNMGPDKVELPRNLYRHEKLVVLKLRDEIDLDIPDSVFLPNLKVLYLESLQCLDETRILKLMSGSPVLQELVITRWYRDDVQTLYVCSSSLKSLTIRVSMRELDWSRQYKLVVDAPNLEFLELSDRVTKEWNVIQLASLVKANVDIGFPTALKGHSNYVAMMMQLLTQISCVKILHLTEYTPRNLPNAADDESPSFENLPTFHNLNHLRIRLFGKRMLILPNILKCSPTLKVLVLSTSFIKWNWRSPKFVPQCLLVSLEVIKLRIYLWNSADMEMAAYFLKNALVLKRMTISPGICRSKDGIRRSKEDLLKELSMFPRRSRECQIEFGY